MPKDDAPLKTDDAATGKRKRLSRADREQQIVAEAVRYFAEVGFGGQTRELARRIGISQSLLFRYFPTKDDIIERVYEEVYVQRWSPAWEDLLADRSRPFEYRLQQFYKEYTAAIFEYEWVRIFVHSGITGITFYHQYIKLIRDRVLKAISVEMRHHCGLPDDADNPVSQREIDLVWQLHGGIFYIAIRKYIYGYEDREDFYQVMEDSITTFLTGAPAIFEACVSTEAGQRE